MVKTLSAVVLASRGIWSLGIFLFANWSDLNRNRIVGTKEADGVGAGAGEASDPHLNELLRREIVYYSLQGIKIAVLENQMEEQFKKRALGSSSTSRPSGISLFVRT